MTAWQWLRQRPLLYLWLPLVAWMGLIFFLSSQPDLPHPETRGLNLLISSMAHAFMFGVLAVLWARALGQHRHVWILVFALTMFYAVSDEFHQAFVPGRQPDLWDLVCDGLGAALGLLGWTFWQQR